MLFILQYLFFCSYSSLLEAFNERKCFSSVRVKLCGYHRSGSNTQENQFGDHIKISMPILYSNTTMYIGIQQITPEQFNCFGDEGAESCKNQIEAKPTKLPKMPRMQSKEWMMNLHVSKKVLTVK